MVEHEAWGLKAEKLVRLTKLLSDEQARDPRVHGLIISVRRPNKLIREGLLKPCQTPGMWVMPPIQGWPTPLYLYVMVPSALPRTPEYYFWRDFDPRLRPFVAESGDALTLEDIMKIPATIEPNSSFALLDRYFDYFESDPALYHLSPRVKAREEGLARGREEGIEKGIEKGKNSILMQARARGMEGLRGLAQALAPWLLEQLQAIDDIDAATALLSEAVART